MAKGPIPPLPALDAPADLMAQARANCAARARAKGCDDLAAQYEAGTQDLGWSIRHEVNRLRAEAAAIEALATAEDNLDHA